jgi:AraC-like DNA-binding protein
MNYHYHKTDPKLADYVRTVLVFDNDIDSSDLPLFTNGMPALLYKACPNPSGTNNRITLFGQSVPVKEWTTENNETTIAFFFKPFALGTIFKLSAQDLKAKPIELNLWNAQKTMALNVQLYYSKSTQEKIEILTHFILSQIEVNQRDCEIVCYATDTLMQNSDADILSKLKQELNLTERTFQRIFKKYVGVTANEYRRICQHYFAFSQLKGGHFEKQTEVAYTNGYFDQSHFTRSFKEFTNITPTEYLQSGLDKRS